MNKLILIALSIILSLPVLVWADDNVNMQVGTVPVVNKLDEDLITNVNEKQYKEPISKRKIAKKFLAAMGGVAISSFAIYFLLTAYNHIREGFENSVKTSEGETTLETPEDLTAAIKIFLDKTKW